MTPKFIKPEIHNKGWGKETWIINKPKYCLKILEFKEGKSFSMHYHIMKEETWYISKGKLQLDYFDLSTAERVIKFLIPGDIVDIAPNIPHKIKALTDAEIIEVSTTHFEEDSYRVEPGDSQNQKCINL